MRFDDRLAIVLARAPDRPSARAAQWRQLLDLLAQTRGDGDGDARIAAATRLIALGSTLPVDVRRDAVAALGGRPVDPMLVAEIARDVPAVAGALLSRVRLDDRDWLALIPALGPTARAFLRHRRDLSAAVTTGLAAFGGADLVLGSDGGTPAVGETEQPVAPGRDDAFAPPPPAAIAPPVADDDTIDEADADAQEARVLPFTPVAEPFRPDAGRGQIRSIISRIARFRGDGGVPDEPVTATASAAGFSFETDRDGVIRQVAGIARGALVGETIAQARAVGVEAPIAYARRARFRDVALAVGGTGAAAGEWRIAAVPVFAADDGRFLGYRGAGRRAVTDRSPDPAPPGAAPGAGGYAAPDRP